MEEKGKRGSYDQVDKIPFDKIEEFFNTNLK